MTKDGIVVAEERGKKGRRRAQEKESTIQEFVLYKSEVVVFRRTLISFPCKLSNYLDESE